MLSTSPRVVIAHDYVTQRGGAERVVLSLLRAFPGARLVTSCWNRATAYPDFGDFDVETLWTDRVGSLRNDPRRAFPFLAEAFGNHTIRDADVVLCSSSGWAHRVQTTGKKVVYCHNPARWLYQPHDYFSGLPTWMRAQFVRHTEGLRRSDTEAALTADRYLVNSTAVAGRVFGAYGIDAEIVPPARGLSPDGPMTPVPGIEPGFLLTVSRARGYKHTDAICEAVARLPGERLVVVGGMHNDAWPLAITGLSDLTDAQMRWLYANASGLVAVANEDFGLTPVEAQAFGLPSVTLNVGGYLDSSVEGVTAVFIDEPTPAQIRVGISELRSRRWDTMAIKRHGEHFSPASFAQAMHRVVDDVFEPAPLRVVGNLPALLGRTARSTSTVRSHVTSGAVADVA